MTKHFETKHPYIFFEIRALRNNYKKILAKKVTKFNQNTD